MNLTGVMESQGKKHLKCPCCGDQISPISLTTLFKQIESLVNGRCIWWALHQDQIMQKIDRFQWACDNCFESHKATIAHPEIQTFSCYPPFLAYFDIEKICSTCKRTFLFGAKEQEFWYETLKFYVQSEAKNCPACRKKAREQINIKHSRVERTEKSVKVEDSIKEVKKLESRKIKQLSERDVFGEVFFRFNCITK